MSVRHVVELLAAWLAEGPERAAPFVKASVATHTLRIRDAGDVDAALIRAKNFSVIRSRKAVKITDLAVGIEPTTT